MKTYQQEFIDLALANNVLRFGEFTLKSGRVSPYFFNAGLFNTGQAMAVLGRCYAQAIIEHELKFDVLFGPAYKGIPLVAATAIALAELKGVDVPLAFNRKEAKAHGEGGMIVGAPIASQHALILDDVMTAGTAVRQVLDLLEQENSTPAGVLIALDRQEKGQGELSAMQELAQDYTMPVKSIIGLDTLMSYLENNAELKQWLPAMQAYRSQYGV